MRSSVKIFVIRLFLVLLPFLVLFSWIEYKARGLPNTYAQKKRGIERMHDSIQVLVLGSSHALKGINPDFFSCRGYNFSNSSQTLFYDTRLLFKYLDRMPQLKAVIVEINYLSLSFELSGSPERWRENFYDHYYDIRGPEYNRFTLPALTYMALYTKEFINDLVFGKLDYKKEFGDIRPNGWESTAVSEENDSLFARSGKERARLHNFLVNPGNRQVITNYLDEMTTALNKRNVAVCFIAFPVHKTYSDYLDPEIERKNLIAIKRLSEDLDALFYDFSRSPLFTRADFSDNDHLDSIGAAKFSRLIDSVFVARACRGER